MKGSVPLLACEHNVMAADQAQTQPQNQSWNFRFVHYQFSISIDRRAWVWSVWWKASIDYIGEADHGQYNISISPRHDNN